MTLITWASLRRPSYKTTSFPGSLLFTPQEAREGRPWLGLVTCLPKSGRLQISGWREGRLSVSLPILSVPGMGKHAESRVFQRSCQVVQKHLKRCLKRANLWMWAAVDFVNQLEILEILAKSLQQSRNRLLLAETEELLYGHALPLCEFLPRLLCRPRERRPNNFRVVRSTISESQVSFWVKGQAVYRARSRSPRRIRSNIWRPGKNQTWPEMCLEAAVAAD